MAMERLALIEALKKKKISKRKFAKLLNQEYNTVFRYFRPGYDPKLSTLNKWAEALGVRISNLLKSN